MADFINNYLFVQSYILQALVAINEMMRSTTNLNKSVKRKIDIDGDINNGKRHAPQNSVALTFSLAGKEEENPI